MIFCNTSDTSFQIVDCVSPARKMVAKYDNVFSLGNFLIKIMVYDVSPCLRSLHY